MPSGGAIYVQTTRRVFEAADAAGVPRFVFASTYSNYGLSPDGEPVTEDSPLHPQSQGGIGEVRDALRRGLISAPRGRRYRNARAVVR